MFCAGHTVSKKDVIDNVVTIPVNAEVETVDGWKNCTDIVIGDKLKDEFEDFVKGLQKNLNPSVTNGQAIEMLAQHMITRPVFDALFEDYHFVKNNAVSRSFRAAIFALNSSSVMSICSLFTSKY